MIAALRAAWRSDRPLDGIGSVRVKLGFLVAASVVVAALVALVGDRAELPVWVTLPVTVAGALLVTQWLARGMTSPLREMTAAAERMAAGDHSLRVSASSRDEVGDLGRAFNAMAADLAGTDRERRQLVATVAHELRTPLAAQRALLENVADGIVAPDDATLRAALGQAERLSDLVTDLLDLSRIDAGVAPLRLEDVPVRALLDDAVAEAAVHGRDLEHVISVSPPGLVVSADPARLSQLVVNLLDNAGRHVPPGGRVRLMGTTDAAASTWRLEVQDDGPGFPDGDTERLFDRFGTGPDASGGTGLGLAIARWVCELHGGTIAALPAPTGSDVGARLRIELPLAPDQPRHPESPVVTTRPVDGTPDVTPSGPPEEPRVSTTTPPDRDPAPLGPAGPGRVVQTAPRGIVDDLFGRWWPEGALPAQPALLLASLAVGLLAALLLPDHRTGIGYLTVAVAVGAALLLASARRRQPLVLASVALGIGLASLSVLRSAEWLGLLGILVAGGTLTVALTGARSALAVVLVPVAWVLSAVRGLPLLARTVTATRQLSVVWPALRTGAAVLLALLVFGGLFASGDAVFGSWVSSLAPELAWDSIVVRSFLLCFVGGVTLAGCYLALNPPTELADRLPNAPTVRRTWEWLVPLGTVIALFLAFHAAQSAALWGGEAYLRRTTGLTYADYVHQGFGQLTVITFLTLVVIGVTVRVAPLETARDRLLLRGSLGLLCLLATAVVWSALHRMDLYQDAYGFTVLRLFVVGFELWLGMLVLLTLVAVLRLSGTWLPRTAVLTGAGALLVLGALNPDAWVAEHNIERYEQTGRLDAYYLSYLGDDAAPVIVDTLPTPLARCVLEELTERSAPESALDWNLGRHRAAQAREQLAEERATTMTPDDCYDLADSLE